MKSEQIALVFCALLSALAYPAAAAPACDVKATVPDGARVFAKLSGDSPWHEYRTLESVPEPTGAGLTYAQYWLDKDGAPSAFMLEMDQDYSKYVRYCFSSGNQLESIGFVVTTTWGWGYKMDGTVMQGALQVESSGFFNTYSFDTIPRPDGASAHADALNLALYLETSKLPFAALLSQPSTSNPK